GGVIANALNNGVPAGASQLANARDQRLFWREHGENSSKSAVSSQLVAKADPSALLRDDNAKVTKVQPNRPIQHRPIYQIVYIDGHTVANVSNRGSIYPKGDT